LPLFRSGDDLAQGSDCKLSAARSVGDFLFMAATKTAESGIEFALGRRDAGLAISVVAILTILFLPLPSFMIDAGLALSIALSIVILMVALWIQRPLEFSAFPTILLIATLLRLSLNVATTRLILRKAARDRELPVTLSRALLNS
jgi:flagellar biosynthesis component FlhA